jgi:N-acetylmuramidase/Putative peptidoglycan binding domain
MPEFVGPGTPLTEQGISKAAASLGVGAAELWAVMSVETSGCGFLPDKRPKILFERHLFHRLTDGQFDDTNPGISDATAGGYGAGGVHQYDRLAEAIGLDRDAALQSASWGLGQILGANFAAAGFADVETMVQAMTVSEDAQLMAMASFIKANGLAHALTQHDWREFARRYNGPAFEQNDYDGKLRDFFAQFSGGELPDLEVRTVQVLLTYKGFNPGAIDGDPGQRTANAIRSFQRSVAVPETGEIDAGLVAALA